MNTFGEGALGGVLMGGEIIRPACLEGAGRGVLARFMARSMPALLAPPSLRSRPRGHPSGLRPRGSVSLRSYFGSPVPPGPLPIDLLLQWLPLKELSDQGRGRVAAAGELPSRGSPER